MEKRCSLLGILCLFIVSLNAQTPYFYYYNGEKQYLELDTKHIFFSVSNENTIQKLVSNETKYQSLRPDLPSEIHLLRLDTANNIVSGTFSFKAKNSESGVIKTITKGRFNIKITHNKPTEQ